MRTKHAITLPLLLSLACSVAAKVEIPFEKNVDLKGIDRIEIRLFSGNITALGEARSNARFEVIQIFNTDSRSQAERWAKEIERVIEKRGSTLVIEFRAKDKTWSGFKGWFGSWRAQFKARLAVPRNIDLSLHTSGGSIEAREIEGDVESRTSGGHMAFSNIHGRLDARTSGGHIEVSEIVGPTDLRTSGGHIRASSVQGSAELRTSGGHIEARSIAGPLAARTSGGHVEAQFGNGILDSAELRTSGGNISIAVPIGQSFSLDAQTSGGHIKSDLPVEGDDANDKSRLAGQVNGGGPLLQARTSGGSIRIRQF